MAQLARLAINESDIDRYRRELSAILVAVERLRSVPGDSASVQPAATVSQTRVDQPVDRGEANAIMAAAPQRSGAHIRLPGGTLSP